MRRQSWLYRGLVVAGLVLGLALPTQAALVGRLEATSGAMDYQAYYDTDRDITWAANANILGGTTGWSTADNWARNILTIDGVSGWRLPTTTQPDPTCSNQDIAGTGADGAFGCTGSEMGHLFASTSLPVAPGEGIIAAAPGVFSNVQVNFYWSGTEFPSVIDRAWIFSFSSGNQNAFTLGSDASAWAVHDGDVGAAVPEPGTLLLMGSGLVGLLVCRRLRRG